MNFKIVYVAGFKDDDGKTPIFAKVDEFTAENYEKAAEFTKDYNQKHTDRTYYWMNNSRDFGVLHEDGSVSWYDTITGDFGRDAVVNSFIGDRIYPSKKELKAILKSIRNRGTATNREYVEKSRLIKKIAWWRWISSNKAIRWSIYMNETIKDNIKWFGWRKWKNMFVDWLHERRRIKYFRKNHHDIQEYWSLDEHMLDDLKWNLKILIEKSHGIPNNFIVDALNNRHKDEPDFNADEWMAEHNHEWGDEELEKEAVALRNSTYNEIIHTIDLYRFYSGNLDDDFEKTPDMVNVLHPGTYDMIDYSRMYEIAQTHWKRIWEFMSKHGQGMWD